MKKSRVSLALVALVLGWPGNGSAQQPPPPPGLPRPPRARAFSFGDHHGRLGALVNTGADPTMDSVGARLEAVTPGGPAAKAGLKAGDVITRFNGTALAGVRAEDEDASGPGQKLVQLARALAPGDTVQIEYRRGSDTKKTTLVAADVSGMGRMMGMDRVELTAPHIMQMLPGPEGGFSFCFGDA